MRFGSVVACVSLLAMAFLLAGRIGSHASVPAPCEAVRFAPGRSAASVVGVASFDGVPRCYSFQASAGQTATLRFARANPNLAFTVDGVADDRSDLWFRTEARSYRVSVFQTLRASPVPFVLEIAIR